MSGPLLLVHAAATLFMTGVIWTVQLVHYPLFDGVDPGRFADWESRHQRRISLVVVPAMLVEAASAGALWLIRPESVGLTSLTIASALLLLVWLSTFVLSVPEHRRLSSSWDAAAHRRLVLTNWPRTLAWTARSGIVLLWLRPG